MIPYVYHILSSLDYKQWLCIEQALLHFKPIRLGISSQVICILTNRTYNAYQKQSLTYRLLSTKLHLDDARYMSKRFIFRSHHKCVVQCLLKARCWYVLLQLQKCLPIDIITLVTPFLEDEHRIIQSISFEGPACGTTWNGQNPESIH